MSTEYSLFRESPFYYDAEEKLNLVRAELKLPDDFLDRLDDIDDNAGRETCQLCGTIVGWAYVGQNWGRWVPVGLARLGAGLTRVFCASCMPTFPADDNHIDHTPKTPKKES